MEPDILISLQDWVRKGQRTAIITLGGYGLSPEHYSVHVHDYQLGIGDDVHGVHEIDLIGKKKRQIEALRHKIDRLEKEVEEYGNA